MEEFISRLEKLSKEQLIALLCDLSQHPGAGDAVDAAGASDPIVIVGMSCRFPGSANSCDDYWNMLMRGATAVVGSPDRRWDIARYLGDAADENRTYTMAAGLMDNLQRFDARFFNIAPREAETMDPQQRIVLEEVWTALEKAGMPPASCQGRNYGVFLGVAANEYMSLCRGFAAREDGGYFASGNMLNMIPGRVAYLLGIHGPVMAIDTACSSALAAVHAAMRSLRNDECTAAIAGGINTLLDPENFVALAKAKMLSPTGLCHVFDQRADGYVRAEGCGILILKKQSAALAARDNILAVIRGSAMTHNGRSSSITAPSMQAQQAAIHGALADAGCSPADVELVEAHGTGTALGDPIEVHSLDGVYGKEPRAAPLYVTSVKANIGHAEAAAGVAGLMKCVLSLQHEAIPRQAGFRRLNSNITLSGDSIVVPTDNVAWRRGSRRRTCAVSSFGFSGVNVHMIVGEAPRRDAVAAPQSDARQILALSAKSPAALRGSIRNYINYLEGKGREENLADICYTVNARKSHYDTRIAVAGSSHAQLAALLGSKLDELESTGTHRHAGTQRIVLVLRGAAPGALGLIVDLYRRFHSFRTCAGRYRPLLRALLALDLDQLSRGRAASRDVSCAEISVAASYVLECLLLDWLRLVVPELTHLVHATGAGQLTALSACQGVEPERLVEAVTRAAAGSLGGLRLDLYSGLRLASFSEELRTLVLDDSALRVIIDAARSERQARQPVAAAPRAEVFDISQVHDLDALLDRLAQLYVEQNNLQWTQLYDDSNAVVDCPSYAFERQRHWVRGGPVLAEHSTSDSTVIEDLEITQEASADSRLSYRCRIGGTSPSLLQDHRLFGRIVVPGSFYISLATQLLSRGLAADGCLFTDVEFLQVLTLDDGESREFLVEMVPLAGAGRYQVFFKSRESAAQEYATHCVSLLQPLFVNQESDHAERLDPRELADGWARSGSGEEFYREFAARGYTLGARFQCVGDGWVRDARIVRRITRCPSGSAPAWQLDPGMLDSFFQVVGGWEALSFEAGKLFVPFRIASLRLIKSIRSSEQLWCRLTIDDYSREAGAHGAIRTSLNVHGDDGHLRVAVSGFELRAINRTSMEGRTPRAAIVFEESWRVAARLQRRGELPRAEPAAAGRWILITAVAPDSESCSSDAVAGLPRISRLGSCCFENGDSDVVDELFDVIEAAHESLSPRGAALNLALYLPGSAFADEAVVPDQAFPELLALLRFLQRLSAREGGGAVNVLFLVNDGERAFSLKNAMYLSLLRCFRNEHPSIGCKVAILAADMQRAEASASFFDWMMARAEAELKLDSQQVLSRAIEPAPQLEAGTAAPRLELGNCLITGGSGAIGEKLARWLVEQRAAKALVLVGRRSMDARLSQLLAELGSDSVKVYYHCVDFAHAGATAALVTELRRAGLGIDTIFHAAGVLHDATIRNIERSSLAAQLAVKCSAVHSLLRYCSEARLVVSFSSIAAAFGSAGQAAYAAANGFLDALPEYLLERGVRALTVSWGPWAESGMAERMSAGNRSRLQSKGIKSLSPQRALAAFAALAARDARSAIVADIDVGVYAKSLPSGERGLFAGLPGSAPSAPAGEAWIDRLRGEQPAAALAALRELLCGAVARITRTSAVEVQRSTLGFHELGMDSLMVMELKKLIEEQLRTQLGSSVIFNYPKVGKLAEYLLQQVMGHAAEAQRETRAPAPSPQQASGSASRRSLDEVASELARELDADV